MHSLFEGFLHYRQNALPNLAPLFNELAAGQNPTALFFGCSDSRFDPNLITSSLPGQIFVHRSVGNLIPPANEEGLSRGDFSEASAVEYAVEILGVKDVVVFGHSGCGAMNATLTGGLDPALTPNLVEWLTLAKPSLKRMAEISGSDLSEVDRLSQANVLTQMDHLVTYPAIKRRLATQSVSLHGAWFDVRTGAVHYFFPEERRFRAIGDDRG